MNEYHNEVSVAEKTAFVKHINATLNHIKDLSNVLPLDPNSDEIFEAVKSGILLWYPYVSLLCF